MRREASLSIVDIRARWVKANPDIEMWSLKVDCRKCQVTAGNSCITANGVKTRSHIARMEDGAKLQRGDELLPRLAGLL